MASSERVIKPTNGAAPLRGLVRLRGWAIGLLALALASVHFIVGAELPLVALSLAFAVAAASNVVLSRSVISNVELPVATIAALDTLLLTLMLALTGGPSNPLSVLYLIIVTLAATLTRARYTWLVVALSSSGYAITFFWNVPLPAELGGHAMHHHHEPYSFHMQGMWVAYTLSAVTIALFVTRLSESLRREREERGRAARLLGLATLAAGAAHEIGNPLGTIRLAATELQRDLEKKQPESEQLADLRLINAEVDRAQQVLRRMAIGAGELMGETPVPVTVRELVTLASGALGEAKSRVDTELSDALPSVRWPVHATAQVLTQLLRNGLDASPSSTTVRCQAKPEGSGVLFQIDDRGSGMSQEVLERLGEPFFTTRPGEGMGLGMFIARSLVAHLGGQLSVNSSEGRGTEVRLWLPMGAEP
jgi:two-component system sensor histidine kinase RegB